VWSCPRCCRPSLHRPAEELSYIAKFFNTVEINSSFYGPPRRQVAKTWIDRIADNSDFRFTAKLWKGFTHERKATADDERLFKDGMEPLLESGRLGAILMQFPWSYRNEPENRVYLRRLRNRFADFPVVVEVRHGSWIEPNVLDEFAELVDRTLQYRSAIVPPFRQACRNHDLIDRLRTATGTQLQAMVLKNCGRPGAV